MYRWVGCKGSPGLSHAPRGHQGLVSPLRPCCSRIHRSRLQPEVWGSKHIVHCGQRYPNTYILRNKGIQTHCLKWQCCLNTLYSVHYRQTIEERTLFSKNKDIYPRIHHIVYQGQWYPPHCLPATMVSTTLLTKDNGIHHTVNQGQWYPPHCLPGTMVSTTLSTKDSGIHHIVYQGQWYPPHCLPGTMVSTKLLTKDNGIHHIVHQGQWYPPHCSPGTMVSTTLFTRDNGIHLIVYQRQWYPPNF